MQKPVISAVICTYNRAHILEGAIESLIHQDADPELFEILVIDNNSSDNTAEIAKKFENYENFRYIFEPKQGVSRARNRGCKEARGEYIAYLDDDAKADSEWIRNIFTIISSQNSPCVIGGPIYPFYLTEKPDWFLDKYEIRTFGNKPRYLKSDEYFSASNIIIVKTILEQFDGFDINSGPKGEIFVLGEETFLQNKIREGLKMSDIFYYSPELKIYHIVPQEKMTVKHFIKRRFMVGQSSLYYRFGNVSLLKRMILPLPLIGIIFLMGIIALLRRPFYRYRENWIAECLDPIIMGLGLFTECLGLRMNFMRYELKEN